MQKHALEQRVERERKREIRRRTASLSVKDGLADYYRSPILDLFHSQYVAPPCRQKKDPKRITIPREFSLTTNARDVLQTLVRIVAASREARDTRLILDFRNVANVGLGADSVLGTLLTEIKREGAKSQKSYIKGFKPKNKDAAALMDEIGSVRVLFSDADMPIKLAFGKNKNVYRVRRNIGGATQAPLQMNPQSEMTKDFADHLNECLNGIGRSLTADGRTRFCDYFGEILDNVNEHSHLGECLVAGYLNLDEEVPIYRCVITSFGKSFAQTFLDADRESRAWKDVAPYIAYHTVSSMFSPDWRQEDLLAVAALQGDISSKNQTPEDDRGQGTVNFIEFFQQVYAECKKAGAHPSPSMCIVTGSTSISFDGTYKMSADHSGRQVIAFNPTNSLHAKPDGRYVTSLAKEFFPGTLISIRIPLSGKDQIQTAAA